MNNLHPIFAKALKPWTPKLPTYVIGSGIKVAVGYDYTPGEPAVYDIESPACGPAVAPEVDIYEVWLGDTDICELLSDDVIESLKDQILAGVQS